MARKKSKANYFTKETEQAIVRYNNEKNFETRSNIYQKEIHYPFFKLTQNIIHTFKFYHTEVENLEDLQIRLQSESDQIQCVVSNNLIENSVGFGQTQKPNLWDYADNVDTIAFLLTTK